MSKTSPFASVAAENGRSWRQRIRERLAAADASGDARQRLLANVEGPVSDELLELIAQPTRHAAVLLALIQREAGWTLLFTERARHLAHHPGQISFPGGRVASPTEGAVAAALREAWEEVRLEPAKVDVAGALAEHITGTGFTITPIVGFVPDGFEPTPDPGEVASVFEVPLAYALDARNVRLTYRMRHGTRFRVYEIEYAGHLIWGATAAILVSFRDLINVIQTK
jgi:8-oxo-dGTP pyrophosphatase MutT (NUDIX family)